MSPLEIIGAITLAIVIVGAALWASGQLVITVEHEDDDRS